jgi:phosphoglycolate phosphatase-like HAD superfamily hydrolase
MTPSRCAVVFDWNGTILADTSLCVYASNKTLELFGLPPVTLAQYQDAYEMPLWRMYQAFGCKEREILERKTEIFGTFAEHYEKGAHRIRPRKGARQTLGTLKERKNKLAVLSNYTVERISHQAKRLGLLGSFDSVLANQEGGEILHKKGKGERLRAFIEAHETEKALVIGDTPEEIEIAHTTVYGVAIKDGVCSLSRCGPQSPIF